MFSVLVVEDHYLKTTYNQSIIKKEYHAAIAMKYRLILTRKDLLKAQLVSLHSFFYDAESLVK